MKMRNLMTSLMNAKWMIVAAALAAATGCTVGPNYKAPQTASQDAYSTAVNPAAATQPVATTQPVVAVDPAGAWWTSFNDPALNRLIEQSMTSNLNLRAAEARVREARAQRGVAASGWYPTV